MLLRSALLVLALLTLPGLSQASGGALGGLFGGGSQNNFLPVDQAFRPQISQADAQQVRVWFDIEPGYYLYLHRLGFRFSEAPEALANIRLPAGEAKSDEFFGDVEVFYNGVEIILELTPGIAPGGLLEIDFQGCADAGLCYPPETVSLPLPQTGAGSPRDGPASSGFGGALNDGRLGLALLLFFLAGLGLTFTPCVLPMLPILSAMVVGRSDINRPRAFALALSYVLGMALSFALVGALIGLFGAALNIQARLQSPWVLGTFALFFVIFALAMFDVLQLRLPGFIRGPAERLAGHTRGGSIPGAAVMGVLSTLVVSPCISAPLAGALVYISSTGDALGGAATLFALAIGMGVPLLLVAVFGNALLPRSGDWLNTVKQIFGFGLLGVAIWLLERVLPGSVSLALWAALAAGLAVRFGLFERVPQGAAGKLGQTLALLAALYAAAALFGALAGGSDPLRPLAPLTGSQTQAASSTDSGFFTRAETTAELDRLLAQAAAEQRPAVVELYADWCISCKVIEREVLGNDQVRNQLAGHQRIKFDVTRNSPEQRDWMMQRQLFGPPSFLFYDASGIELQPLRILGDIDLSAFLAHMQRVTAN